jgi:L,D-transpeptidase YcbB
MDHVVVNPSWFVPPSIMKNEFLPKLAADPDYAAKKGFEVVRRGNSISVRQPPGERNALGHIKFMFPNDHAVYLHDTPSRGLFSNARRAFSHGCVRVDQPFRLAEFIMGKDAGYSEARLRGMVGSGERTVKLPKALPVHITYMTHVVDRTGALTVFEDIYGFHALVRNTLVQQARSLRL